jgi:hypothetical protein
MEKYGLSLSLDKEAVFTFSCLNTRGLHEDLEWM